MALALERRADGTDASVHHVGGRDDVGAGRGLDQRLPGEHRAGRIVEHIARCIDEAIMAVRRIGIERDVGEDADFRRGFLHRPNRPADQIVGIERLARVLGAKLARRVGEQGDAGDAEVARLARPVAEPVDRPARDPGQAGDRLLQPLPFGDEQGPDPVGRSQHRLRKQRPAPGGGAGAAEPEGWESGMAHGRGCNAPSRPCKARLDERRDFLMSQPERCHSRYSITDFRTHSWG